ncbi:hypothetical protein DM2_2826 [Halorubrum sp. DM2]|uniref:hypothetical protein n=1 Tax=unclassified Halorubrum TaxID=2642239 RepID=UPI0003DC220D|nr:MULTISPECIES: hypothetical protein [unclassified Halorubrum]CDK40085.1 uncharacterized protein BN903_91 [Halorubrum sp. AJ67]VTT86788.1 hypothetical protein DM2_2826 [Halorubrum sp. DM2]
MSGDESRTPEPVDADITAEACGRCSMSTVVGAVADDQSSEERAERDPFADERIEVDESSLRRISPAGYLGDLKERINGLGRRIAYGK